MNIFSQSLLKEVSIFVDSLEFLGAWVLAGLLVVKLLVVVVWFSALDILGCLGISHIKAILSLQSVEIGRA